MSQDCPGTPKVKSGGLQTLPSNEPQEQEDSPLTGCLKELESELLADRRIPDDPVQSNRLQAVQKLALLDVDLQPRLLQV